MSRHCSLKRYTVQCDTKEENILSISIIEPASVLQLCARHHPAYTPISTCHALKCA